MLWNVCIFSLCDVWQVTGIYTDDGVDKGDDFIDDGDGINAGKDS